MTDELFLVFGKKTGVDVVNAELLRNLLGTLRIVTCHHDGNQVLLLKLRNEGHRTGFNGISLGDISEDLIILNEETNGVSGLQQLL
jgi:hypothetical protein